ncbi:MAG: hypothetical protein RR557_07490 [Bacilli bacterium]
MKKIICISIVWVLIFQIGVKQMDNSINNQCDSELEIFEEINLGCKIKTTRERFPWGN